MVTIFSRSKKVVGIQMYIYAHFDNSSKIVIMFSTENELLDAEFFPNAILVDAIHEDWIQRKKWDETTQTFVDVSVSETNTHNSLEFTHIDSDGVKHWLDDFVNDLASSGSVEAATVTEVETYLSI